MLGLDNGSCFGQAPPTRVRQNHFKLGQSSNWLWRLLWSKRKLGKGPNLSQCTFCHVTILGLDIGSCSGQAPPTRVRQNHFKLGQSSNWLWRLLWSKRKLGKGPNLSQCTFCHVTMLGLDIGGCSGHAPTTRVLQNHFKLGQNSNWLWWLLWSKRKLGKGPNVSKCTFCHVTMLGLDIGGCSGQAPPTTWLHGRKCTWIH